MLGPLLGLGALVKYYVAFLEDERFGSWWDVFTQKRFRHVAACRQIEGITQNVEYLRGRLFVESFALPVGEWLRVLEDYRLVTAIVEFEVAESDPFHYNLRGILTCVTIVKSFIGVNSPLVVTPKQLFRELMRRGGRILWAAEDQAHPKRKDSKPFKLFRGLRLNSFAKKNLRGSAPRPHNAEREWPLNRVAPQTPGPKGL